MTLVLALLVAADPMAILRDSVAAVEKNGAESRNFLYREVITQRYIVAEAEYIQTSRKTYEVVALVGEPFEKLIAIDNQPLPPEMAAEEEKRARDAEAFRKATPLAERMKRRPAFDSNRLWINYEQVLHHHKARLRGEETVNGRRCWVIDFEPKEPKRSPAVKGEILLVMRGTVWVDQENFLRRRMHVEQVRDAFGVPKGSTTETDWTVVEGVSLPARILSRRSSRFEGKKATFEIEQVYSNYRRFGSESTIQYAPEMK
ncbi:MAG: hypothetical protein MUC42_17440 [Bryobacter sp.]|nr:hypothetical protein [Bryobacter sp.]